MTRRGLEDDTFTLHELAQRDLTPGELRGLRERGEVNRIAPGAYSLNLDWEDMAISSRYRHVVRRRWERSRLADAVISHVSAAALWGLPLPHPLPTHLHLSGYKKNAGRTNEWVTRHSIAIPEQDVTERDGMPCTTLDRTVVDVAMSESMETAVMCADAALRMRLNEMLDSRTFATTTDIGAAVQEIKDSWRRLVRSRSGHRGVRQAREIVEFANWQAESPGESVSRLRMQQIGLPAPELQVPVPSPHGAAYRLDFLLRAQGVFGEFDGLYKYADDPRAARNQVILEKQREEWIRSTTGWRCIRWGWSAISSAKRFETTMRKFQVLR